MNFIFLILVVLMGLTLALPPIYDYFLFICNIGFCKKCAKLVTAKETRENRISRHEWKIFNPFWNHSNIDLFVAFTAKLLIFSTRLKHMSNNDRKLEMLQKNIISRVQMIFIKSLVITC